jgi:hypothetical protein
MIVFQHILPAPLYTIAIALAASIRPFKEVCAYSCCHSFTKIFSPSALKLFTLGPI